MISPGYFTRFAKIMLIEKNGYRQRIIFRVLGGPTDGTEDGCEMSHRTGKQKNFEAHGHACVVCWAEGEGIVTWHHTLTRKARPDLIMDERNLMPLCAGCHSLIHLKGTTYMSDRYPRVKTWLERRGWTYCDLKKAWGFPQDESTTFEQDQPQKTS